MLCCKSRIKLCFMHRSKVLSNAYWHLWPLFSYRRFQIIIGRNSLPPTAAWMIDQKPWIGFRCGLCAGHNRDTAPFSCFHFVTFFAWWMDSLSSCRLLSSPLFVSIIHQWQEVLFWRLNAFLSIYTTVQKGNGTCPITGSIGLHKPSLTSRNVSV